MSPPITESTIEEAALQRLEELGYAILPEPEIAPETPRIRLGEEQCDSSQRQR